MNLELQAWCWPIADMMFGLATVAVTSTQEPMSNTIPTRTNNFGNSLSSTWRTLICQLLSSTYTTTLAKRCITSATVRERFKCLSPWPSRIQSLKLIWTNTLLLVQWRMSKMQGRIWLTYWTKACCFNGIIWEEFMSSCQAWIGSHQQQGSPFVQLFRKFAGMSWLKSWMGILRWTTMKGTMFWLDMILQEQVSWTWVIGNRFSIVESSRLMTTDQAGKIRRIMDSHILLPLI